MKLLHEVRDPIHNFIEFSNLERDIINSLPYQRLRNIHQLALTSLIYPGATHKRFEHCLGVMELASNIFDKVFDDKLISGIVRDNIAPHISEDAKPYWKRVLRVAALLHDVGHLPFSHAAEKELLPAGWDHERMTSEIIRNSEIKQIIEACDVPMNVEDVVDLAWQPSKRSKHEDHSMNLWKTLLNEIITGDTFGADRVDYLLRDAYHAGVAYGNFDVHRLIGGLRVELDELKNPTLAIEYGAIHAAEALLLARYFMYTQVYMHPLRRVYDEHLKDFMITWLPGGTFGDSYENLLASDDNQVFSAMWQASRGPESELRVLSDRIVRRKHFKTAYELNAEHKKLLPTIVEDARKELAAKFGEQRVRTNIYPGKSESTKFRVKMPNNQLLFGDQVSPQVVGQLPSVDVGLVFVSPEIVEEARTFIETKFKAVFEGKKPSVRKKG